MLSNVIAIISAVTALGSLWFTERQWRKVNRKIAMLSDESAASEVLPAWYVIRMMRDQWPFGLQTTDASVLAIGNIIAVSDDAKWMDIELLTADEALKLHGKNVVFAVAEDRRQASVQIDKIVAAYELVTS